MASGRQKGGGAPSSRTGAEAGQDFAEAVLKSLRIATSDQLREVQEELGSRMECALREKQTHLLSRSAEPFTQEYDKWSLENMRLEQAINRIDCVSGLIRKELLDRYHISRTEQKLNLPEGYNKRVEAAQKKCWKEYVKSARRVVLDAAVNFAFGGTGVGAGVLLAERTLPHPLSELAEAVLALVTGSVIAIYTVRKAFSDLSESMVKARELLSLKYDVDEQDIFPGKTISFWELRSLRKRDKAFD